MLKGLIWGTGLTITAIIISAVTGNWMLGTNICSYLGVASLILAIIVSGSLKSGDGMRAIFSRETKSESLNRDARVNWLSMFALPNIIAALLIYRYLV